MMGWVAVTISKMDYERKYKNDENVRLIPYSEEKDTWVKVLVREDHVKDIKVEEVSLRGYF